MYLLEEFKKYHNANYHDGDDTFDFRTYATVDNDPTEFKDRFVQDCYDHYVAGYQVSLRAVATVVSMVKQDLDEVEDRNVRIMLDCLQDKFIEMSEEVYK